MLIDVSIISKNPAKVNIYKLASKRKSINRSVAFYFVNIIL